MNVLDMAVMSVMVMSLEHREYSLALLQDLTDFSRVLDVMAPLAVKLLVNECNYKFRRRRQNLKLSENHAA